MISIIKKLINLILSATVTKPYLVYLNNITSAIGTIYKRNKIINGWISFNTISTIPNGGSVGYLPSVEVWPNQTIRFQLARYYNGITTFEAISISQTNGQIINVGNSIPVGSYVYLYFSYITDR